jgi:hypothetical protein
VPQVVMLVLAIPMMPLDVFFDLEHLPTARAEPGLLSQDRSTKGRRRPQRQLAVTVLEVGRPGGVKRLGRAFALEGALWFDCRPHAEQLLAGGRSGKAPRCSPVREKVALHDPAPGLVRVPALGPAIHSLPAKGVELGEGLATDTVARRVRPAPQDGGEGLNELRGRGPSGWLTEGAPLVHEGLPAGWAGSNPQLSHLAIRSVVFAPGLPSAVKALRAGSKDGLLRRAPPAPFEEQGGNSRQDDFFESLS